MFPFIVAGLVVVADQVTKALVAAKLRPEESVPVLGDLLSVSLVENTGASFGLFKSQTLILVLVSVIAIIFIVFYLAKKKSSLYLPFALILGGACGNLIDRLRFGYVVDFIDFHWWPVFNVADSCITVGSVILFFVILRGKDASRPV
jgi:signal peptidase II